MRVFHSCAGRLAVIQWTIMGKQIRKELYADETGTQRKLATYLTNENNGPTTKRNHFELPFEVELVTTSIFMPWTVSWMILGCQFCCILTFGWLSKEHLSRCGMSFQPEKSLFHTEMCQVGISGVQSYIWKCTCFTVSLFIPSEMSTIGYQLVAGGMSCCRPVW